MLYTCHDENKTSIDTKKIMYMDRSSEIRGVGLTAVDENFILSIYFDVGKIALLNYGSDSDERDLDAKAIVDIRNWENLVYKDKNNETNTVKLNGDEFIPITDFNNSQGMDVSGYRGVVIITGPRGCGKTSTMIRLAENRFKAANNDYEIIGPTYLNGLTNDYYLKYEYTNHRNNPKVIGNILDIERMNPISKYDDVITDSEVYIDAAERLLLEIVCMLSGSNLEKLSKLATVGCERRKEVIVELLQSIFPKLKVVVF